MWCQPGVRRVVVCVCEHEASTFSLTVRSNPEILNSVISCNSLSFCRISVLMFAASSAPEAVPPWDADPSALAPAPAPAPADADAADAIVVSRLIMGSACQLPLTPTAIATPADYTLAEAIHKATNGTGEGLTITEVNGLGVQVCWFELFGLNMV